LRDREGQEEGETEKDMWQRREEEGEMEREGKRLEGEE